MELDRIIESRKSIRNFDENRPVGREMVEKIIASAQMAPTWKNSQTGRYYVVMDEEKLAEFKAGCLHPYNAKNSAGAPVIIVTTFVRNISGFRRDGSRDNELGNEWGAYDLGLQNAFLLLKAADLGLDSLVMGLRDADKIKGMLEIPEDESVVSVLALGYKLEETPRPDRKPMDDIVRFL